MKTIRIATNLVLGLILLCLLPAIVMQFIRSVSNFVSTANWRPFAIGLVPGAFIGQLVMQFSPWLSILEHELTHAFVGLFFGYIPTGIQVSSKRGLCTQRIMLPWFIPISRPVVTLAPYFLPTMTAVMAALRPVVGTTAQPWYDIGIGATISYHVVTTAKEIRDNGAIRDASVTDRRFGLMTDFHDAGPVFSWLFIAIATIVAHGLILTVISRGYGGVAEDLRRIVTDTLAIRQIGT